MSLAMQGSITSRIGEALVKRNTNMETAMMAHGPLFYFLAAVAIVGGLWAVKQQITWEARNRRRRRKSHFKVVNTARRPTVTFLVRAR